MKQARGCGQRGHIGGNAQIGSPIEGFFLRDVRSRSVTLDGEGGLLQAKHRVIFIQERKAVACKGVRQLRLLELLSTYVSIFVSWGPLLSTWRIHPTLGFQGEPMPKRTSKGGSESRNLNSNEAARPPEI